MTEGTELDRHFDPDAELRALARRFNTASSFGVQLFNTLNWPADALLERLPDTARNKLESLTIHGLEAAMALSSGTRVLVRDQKDWVNTATATAAGVMGGIGGLPTALAELPVTVTLLMRAIQAIAVEHGFDPDDEQTRKDCLLVLAAQGPLAGADKGLDLNFLASRATLNGANVFIGIGLVAPRLASVLGRKLAAQTVPVLGAATAAATNWSYTGYYQQMAHVVFGLRRLSERTATPYAALAQRLQQEIDMPPLKARAS